MTDREDVIRHLALGDQAFLDELIASRRLAPGEGALDAAGEALVKLGALAVTDGSDLTWQQTVDGALDAGVSADQAVDALVVLAPLIGRTRIVAITPKMSRAIGYDLDAALEAR